MTEIQILSVKRQIAGYIELTYKMSFTLPTIWGTGANPIAGLDKIVAAYPANYSIEVIPVTGTIVTATETQSVPSNATVATIKTQLQTRYGELRTALDALTLDNWDSVAGLSWDGSTWTSINLITDFPLTNKDKLDLCVTAIGTSGAAVTATLPAVVGKFHNITHISILAYSTAARTGNATPITVTTTNLSGSPAFTFATAAAIGTTDIQKMEPDEPIRSLTANTATTIVCPATTGVIWRIVVLYNTIS